MNRQMGRRRSPRCPTVGVAALVALGFVDCTCEGRVEKDTALGLATPVLTTQLPSLVNTPEVPVEGTRAADTEVWIHYEHEEAAALLAAAADTGWTGTLTLREGENRFVLFASQGDATSARTDVFTITLDARPPAPPVLATYIDGVFIASGETGTFQVSGTKDADADLRVNDAVRAQIDNVAAFSVTGLEARLNQANTYVFTSQDEAGNVSSEVTLVVIGSSVPPPTVVVTTPWRSLSQTISGKKATDSALYFVAAGEAKDSAANQQLVDTSADAAWSATVDLVEGENIVGVYAVLSGVASPTTFVTIVVDATAPDPPKGIKLSNGDPVPFETDATSLTFTGDAFADAELCVRLEPEPDCRARTSAWPVTVDLQNGDNDVCFSLFDVNDNASAEVCLTIFKVPGPEVMVLEPTAGSVVERDPVHVVLKVTPQQGDESAGGKVSGVEVCIVPAGESCDAGAYQGISGELDDDGRVEDDVSAGDDGVYQLVVRATNALGVQATSAPLIFTVSHGDPEQVAGTLPGYSRDAAVFLDAGGTLHVAFADNCAEAPNCPEAFRGTTGPDIYYRAYKQTWGDIVRVSATREEGDAASDAPSIAVDSTGAIHIVWVDDGDIDGSGPGSDIIHRVVEPDGTLGALTAVTAGLDGTHRQPDLASDAAGGVHLTWVRTGSDARSNVYYAKYAEGQWGPERLVSEMPADSDNNAPAIAVDGDNAAHVVWQSCMPCSAETLLTCTCRRIIASDNLACTSATECGANGLCVGGHCERNADSEIYYRSVSQAVGAITRVTDGETVVDVAGSIHGDGDSVSPDVAVDADDQVWVVWQDTGKQDLASDDTIFAVYARVLTGDGGVQRVSGSSGTSAVAPRIVAAGQEAVAIGWTASTALGDADVYYRSGKASTAGVKGADALLVANTPGVASGVAMAADGVAVHLVWQDSSTLYPSDDPPERTTDDTCATEGERCDIEGICGAQGKCVVVDDDVFYLPKALP